MTSRTAILETSDSLIKSGIGKPAERLSEARNWNELEVRGHVKMSSGDLGSFIVQLKLKRPGSSTSWRRASENTFQVSNDILALEQ
jgi:hypothetical protein